MRVTKLFDGTSSGRFSVCHQPARFPIWFTAFRDARGLTQRHDAGCGRSAAGDDDQRIKDSHIGTQSMRYGVVLKLAKFIA